jgi:SagB-type dehydrogenase family enzyme
MELLQKVKTLLVIVFGKRTEVSCPWSSVPLMRRTTPSGGSRHPTEGYFLSYHISGLPAGWYHVQADPSELVMINKIDQNDEDILYNEPSSYAGMIILTSDFKRTMYRYREPRAFRVPHMDAGHLITTIEILATELSIPLTCHLNFNEQHILQKIGASQFDEGVMAVVGIHHKE